ncbi:MAG: CHRD domain-containing protein [Noviherbaspirillum sp.]|mgnify:CR=1 FL=1
MRIPQGSVKASFIAVSTVAALMLSGCGTMEKMGEKVGIGGKHTELSGSAEVPPVSTKASGKSTIKVADDQSVSGEVTVEGMTPTAAHIHQGAAGANGPVIIPLTKASDSRFTVPANAKLTEAQYAAFQKGSLYVNVHSAAHPGGEIRAQLKP